MGRDGEPRMRDLRPLPQPDSPAYTTALRRTKNLHSLTHLSTAYHAVLVYLRPMCSREYSHTTEV